MRAYKTIGDVYVEPISFTVPRRAETFQADIFPPAIGTKPACSASEWLGGKTGIPSKIDFESIYDGNAPKEVASDFKPTPVASPAPVKPQPKEEPKPAPVSRAPPPTMSEQKGSISAMANRFQDDDEEEADDDDDSSFEEIGRPAQRTNVPVRSEPAKPASPTKFTPIRTKQSAPIKAGPPAHETPASTTTSSPTAPTAGGSGVESTLEQIKSLLLSQARIINTQSEKISNLTVEVEGLKRKIGSGSGSQDQSERIRQLELELEEARS